MKKWMEQARKTETSEDVAGASSTEVAGTSEEVAGRRGEVAGASSTEVAGTSSTEVPGTSGEVAGRSGEGEEVRMFFFKKFLLLIHFCFIFFIYTFFNFLFQNIAYFVCLEHNDTSELPCCHQKIHFVPCLEEWLKVSPNRNSCPHCKQQFDDAFVRRFNLQQDNILSDEAFQQRIPQVHNNHFTTKIRRIFLLIYCLCIHR